MKLFKPKNITASTLRDLFENDKTAFLQSKTEPAPIARDAVPVPEQPLHTPGELELGSARRHAHFNAPDTKFKEIAPMKGGGANGIFKAQTADDHQYVIKPHADADPRHEPEHWESRNAVSNRLLDQMKASHMGVHGFTTGFPDANDGITGSYAGGPSHVTAFNKHAIPAHEATPEQLANISGEHRLTGMVHHVLTSNADGHHGNVLIDPVHNHPVHIDNDLGFDSKHGRSWSQGTEANPSARRAIRSVYNPGEDLDYTKGHVTDPSTGEKRPLGKVGTNFPPHIMQTLKDAREGKLSHGLNPNDHAELVKNAHDLLTHGLEGTMARRHVLPTYKKKHDMLAMGNQQTGMGNQD